MMSPGVCAVVWLVLLQESFAAISKRVSSTLIGLCRRPPPELREWYTGREGKICKFEAPYESWMPDEPKRKRLVKGGRIFDFRLVSSGKIETEGIECEDYFYNYNWRFQGLLERAPSVLYTDAIRRFDPKPGAGFLSEPLRSRYDSLYNEDDDTGGSRVCVAAVEGLWRKMCKDGNLPESGKWNEDRVMHILMDGVCSLNKKKQK
ncbi:hypothetical protein FOZ63_012000, partial [Perkinsus olseni]